MTAPSIAIDAEAQAWLRRRGGALTLRHSPRHGCCGGSARLPVAEPQAPADPTGFDRHRLHGLDVYIARDFAAGGQPVRVGLEGVWKWRRLTVDGAAIASGGT
ncbi:MAG: CC/Se motif family (seleno)protein [Rhodovibrio sp.]|nr:CC/Se motif family (seleno)protein [Rhodovibrio sp.]